MSKLQSSIQKAIEMARGTEGTLGEGNDRPRKRGGQRKPSEGIATGIFRVFPFASPKDEVMEESRIVAATDDKSAKAAYNVLRTRLLQRMRANNWQTLLVTSPGAGEGKSLTSANLAMSIARDVNQSAILVDLDLMRSSIVKYLGINVQDIKAGVGDYLQGKAELTDIIYSPGDIDRLALVPNREPLENSSDLIGSPRMKALVQNLREQSGNAIVIFDMPPVLACDDVLAMAPGIDAILLVVGQGKTERAALEKAMTMLSDFNILGVVLNMTDETSGDGAYGYY